MNKEITNLFKEIPDGKLAKIINKIFDESKKPNPYLQELINNLSTILRAEHVNYTGIVISNLINEAARRFSYIHRENKSKEIWYELKCSYSRYNKNGILVTYTKGTKFKLAGFELSTMTNNSPFHDGDEIIRIPNRLLKKVGV